MNDGPPSLWRAFRHREGGGGWIPKAQVANLRQHREKYCKSARRTGLH